MIKIYIQECCKGKRKAKNILLCYGDFTDIQTIAGGATTGKYTNEKRLKGKEAMIDFNVFANDGSGTLLKPGANGGYLFNPISGTLTMPPNDYLLLF